MEKKVQFITDAEGRRSAVILPIEEYEEMLEDLGMGRAARESKAEPRRPFEDVVKELDAAPFMAPHSLEELARLQGVKPLENVNALAGGFPEDENIDEFLDDIYKHRETA